MGGTVTQIWIKVASGAGRKEGDGQSSQGWVQHRCTGPQAEKGCLEGNAVAVLKSLMIFAVNLCLISEVDAIKELELPRAA